MAYIGKSPSGLGVRTRYYYTATGGETSLSGADDNGRVLKFTDGEYIDVYLNGVLLVAGTDYGTGTANTISSLDPLSAGNIVEIVAYDIHSLAKPNLEALRKRYYKTATGGETSISGNDDDGQAITFAANAEIEVYLNGVALVQGDDYNTTTANTVGGLAALDADDIVSIVAYEEFTLGDVVSKKSGGTFVGGISFTATATFNNSVDVNGNELILDADGDTSITADTDDQIDFKVGGSDVLSVTTSGVDFGATSDASTVSNTGSDYQLQLGAAQSTTGDIGRNISFSSSGTTTAAINSIDAGTGGSQALAFFTGNLTSISERMRLDQNGNVLVGTTSSRPDENSDSGMALTPDGKKYAYSTTDFGVFNSNSTGKKFYFRLNGVEKGSISFNSDGVSYTDTSDYRLKENVTGITDGIQRIKQLNPSRFNFIGDSTIVDGFIAHEAATVVPQAVTGTHNEVETWTQDEIDAGDAPANTSAGDNKLDGDGNTIPVYQGIDKSKLVPLLTAALKEAITKIEALETENATQATTIADFEARIAALEAN